MNGTKLKYEFTEDEVNYLINAINGQQLCGLKSAQQLMHMVALLQKPLNLKELQNPIKQEKVKDERGTTKKGN